MEPTATTTTDRYHEDDSEGGIGSEQPPAGEDGNPPDPDGEPPNRRQQRKRSRRKQSSSIRHAIVVTVPHTAFGPAGLQQGDTCQIPGVGPVPISVVHQLLDTDPIIKAVVTRGRDITAVATLTRTIKEDLRLAVLAANHHTCAVPGCTNTRFLELDHQHHYATGGPTSYDNLRPLCSYHHRQRTTQGYELHGQPGGYQWYAPDGTLLAADPDPANSEPTDPDPVTVHPAERSSVPA